MSDGSVTINTNLNNDGFKSGLSKLGNIAKTGLKSMAVAAGTVTAAFAGIVTASVKARGEIEQSIGGIQTLFGTQGVQSVEEYAKLVGKSVNKVKKEYETLSKAQEIALNNANEAYKTAGMSANDYMQTVTGFAASLKQSCKDEVEAAKIANTAVIDMSDNANKMGTSIELIQNAYQGFAKQNYTMLDNLKLGYGGTKTEMQRLLKDAQKLSGVKYNINNLSDVYNAIHVIQQELGITGTTAKEAADTLQGSMASMSAAWNNFLSDSGDLSQVVGSATNVVTNVVRIVNEAVPAIMESISASLPQLLSLGGEILNKIIEGLIKFLPNLISTAEKVLDGLMKGIVKALPKLIVVAEKTLETLMKCFITYLPQIIESAEMILGVLVEGILQCLPQLIPAGLQIIEMLLLGLITYLPQIIEVGMQVITQLIIGIAQMLPSLIPQIIECIMLIVETLINNLDMLVDAGIELLIAITMGIIEALPILIDKVPEIINKLFDALRRNLPKLINAGVQIIVMLITGLINTIPNLIGQLPNLIKMVFNFLTSGFQIVWQIGKGIVTGLWERNIKCWFMVS